MPDSTHPPYVSKGPSATDFIETLLAFDPGDPKLFLYAMWDSNPCVFQNANKKYFLQTSGEALQHEQEDHTAYLSLVCDDKEHPYYDGDDSVVDVFEKDSKQDRPFKVCTRSYVEKDKIVDAIFIPLDWLAESTQTSTSEGEADHWRNTNYTLLWNISTNPMSLWLVFDRFPSRLDGGMYHNELDHDILREATTELSLIPDNIFSDLHLSDQHDASFPKDCLRLCDKDGHTRYNGTVTAVRHDSGYETSNIIPEANGDLLETDGRYEANDHAAPASNPEGLSRDEKGLFVLSNTIAGPTLTLADLPPVMTSHTSRPLPVKGRGHDHDSSILKRRVWKLKCFNRFKRILTNGETLATPSQEERTISVSKGVTESESSPPQRKSGYLGVKQPFDLALLAPDITKWNADSGFNLASVAKCLDRTHVCLGSSLRAKSLCCLDDAKACALLANKEKASIEG